MIHLDGLGTSPDFPRVPNRNYAESTLWLEKKLEELEDAEVVMRAEIDELSQPYTGSYEATPSNQEQSFETKNKRMTNNFTVHAIEAQNGYADENGYYTPTAPATVFEDFTVNVPTGTARTGADATWSQNNRTLTVPEGLYAESFQKTIDSSFIVPTGTKNIAVNGTQDISQYQYVNVNVGGAPEFQTKTVNPTTSQQLVEPDTGYDGLSSVTVTAIQTQTKDLEPYAYGAGTYDTITPDSGKYLTQARVEKPLTLNKTVKSTGTTQTIAPSSDSADYYGTITVQPVTAEDKSITISDTTGQSTGTGTTTASPSSTDYFEDITVTYPTYSFDTLTVTDPTQTYVASSASKSGYSQVQCDFSARLQNKSVTENGTYTADSGKILNSVTVNVTGGRNAYGQIRYMIPFKMKFRDGGNNFIKFPVLNFKPNGSNGALQVFELSVLPMIRATSDGMYGMGFKFTFAPKSVADSALYACDASYSGMQNATTPAFSHSFVNDVSATNGVYTPWADGANLLYAYSSGYLNAIKAGDTNDWFYGILTVREEGFTGKPTTSGAGLDIVTSTEASYFELADA